MPMCDASSKTGGMPQNNPKGFDVSKNENRLLIILRVLFEYRQGCTRTSPYPSFDQVVRP